MRFRVARFATDGVLASSQLGRRVFAALVGEIGAATEPTLLFLDFQGADVATTSFLREAVVTFRNHARSHIPNIYPIPVNLTPGIREELALFLRERGDAMAVCDLTADDKTSRPDVLGHLDGKQLMTLNAALEAGETDAATLAQQYAEDECVGITAWNNRLAALAARGLLIETSHGRSKRYRPVLEHLKYGR